MLAIRSDPARGWAKACKKFLTLGTIGRILPGWARGPGDLRAGKNYAQPRKKLLTNRRRTTTMAQPLAGFFSFKIKDLRKLKEICPWVQKTLDNPVEVCYNRRPAVCKCLLTEQAIKNPAEAGSGS